MSVEKIRNNRTVILMTSQSLQPEVTVTKPLFPLPLVLFPGGRLPLQIFEARYLDMVGRCMRDGEYFVIAMARSEGLSLRGKSMMIVVLHAF